MNTNFYNQLAGEIGRYFENVTDEQLSADLEGAKFGFYSKLGRQIPISRRLGTFAVQPSADGAKLWQRQSIPARPVSLIEHLEAA